MWNPGGVGRYHLTMAHMAPAVVPRTKQRHWPALDGMRAISILLVMAVHAQLPHAQGGIVGVDVFFVLSGFLITSLLIGEWEKRGKVSLSNFYARRALRLFPALGVAIVLALLIVVIGRSFGQGGSTLDGLPFVVFYIGDFARAFGPLSELGLLGTTWSLAIEEQFYLIWPFVFVLLMPRVKLKERVAIVLAGLSALDMVYRFAMVRAGEPLSRVTFGGDTRCDGLLLGCALAFWLSGRAGRPFSRAFGYCLSIAVMGGLVLTAFVVIDGAGDHPGTFEFGIPVAVVTSAVTVASIVGRPLGPLNHLLELKPLAWLGQRSYGVYLFHYPIFVAVRANGGPHSRQLLGFVLSLLAAALSYRIVEKPALSLKQRFQRTEALTAAEKPSAGRDEVHKHHGAHPPT